jgi:hypothetical protein
VRWVQELGGRKLGLLSATIVAFIAGIVLVVVAFSSSGVDAKPDVSSVITPFAISPTPTVAGQPSPTATVPPSTGAVARMKVPSLGIDFAIEPLGILPSNELDTPHDANNKIGWYHGYVVTNASGDVSYHFDSIPDPSRIGSDTHILKPGYGTNSVFSAHESWNFQAGPFKDLNKANPGDLIVVDMDDGREYTYKIFSKQRYDVNTIPMGDLIWPKDRPADKEWITLITCGGNFVATQANGLGEYTQRDVVLAERIS